jgi:cytochrome bd-type quinol oxidase subunit 2
LQREFAQKFLLCDTMKVSQIAAKAVVRVFFIMLIMALIPYLQGDNTKLEHLYLMPKNVWSLAFPILLILGFVVLLVICSIKKYNKQDLNWLLVVNTLVLIAYAVTLYIRIYQLTK